MAKKGKSGGKKKKSGDSQTLPVSMLLTNAARAARTRMMEHFGELGLYAGQDSVVMALARVDGQSPGALAEMLGVRAPTMTKTINRMAAQGFVEKKLSESDGRRMEVFLTSRGRDTVATIEILIGGAESAMLDGLTGKEVRTLAKLLTRIGENLNRPQAKAS